MATYVGVDWAGKGWFGAGVRADETWTCDLYPSISSVWNAHQDAEAILFDIPIGLPTSNGGRRRCDERAKQLLGPRHRSVFYTPVRPAVYESNLERAKRINEEAGYSIQNQAWGIVTRIREMDEFLDTHPGARDRCRETHPEVCYRALAGSPLESSPTDPTGHEERQSLLLDIEPGLETPLTAAIDTFTTPRFAPLVGNRSHIIDAFVAALTATRLEETGATLPESPPTDERGLPMEIVYPADVQQLTFEDVQGASE